MTERLTIAAVQANPTLGAIEANEALAAEQLARASAAGADLAVFSELFLLGYPPEDLVLKPAAVSACQAAVKRLAKTTARGASALVGLPWPSDGGRPYNAVALLADGEIADVTFKVDLPNYGVFDEKRVFLPGDRPRLFTFRDARIGVPVCEDIWGPLPCESLRAQGAELFTLTPARKVAASRRALKVTIEAAAGGKTLTSKGTLR